MVPVCIVKITTFNQEEFSLCQKINQHFNVHRMIKELLDAGYAKRTRKKVKGLFQPYTYEISELKRFLPDGENRPGSTGPENPVILSTKSSLSEKIGTTTNKSKVVVFSFEKEVFQEELIRIQKMKEALDQRASEWGEEFIIPEQVYVDLSRRYGIEYLIAQFNYMCKLHHNYFKKRNSAYPLEKPIKKPETYFKLACQKNYAGYKS